MIGEFIDFFNWKIVAVAILTCFMIAHYQARTMKLFYSPKNKLMQEFAEKTNIKNLVFRPHFMLLEPLSQAFTLIVLENIQKTIWKNKTEIECFKTPDGGTVGVEWSIVDGQGRPPEVDKGK